MSYQAYLICACGIIRQNGGVITAFDSDRVMAVYIGDVRDSAAARTGLVINYDVGNIINPMIKELFKTAFAVKQAVGIDRSVCFTPLAQVSAGPTTWSGSARPPTRRLRCDKRSSDIVSGIPYRPSRQSRRPSPAIRPSREHRLGGREIPERVSPTGA
jgi:hypothetical protein